MMIECTLVADRGREGGEREGREGGEQKGTEHIASLIFSSVGDLKFVQNLPAEER